MMTTLSKYKLFIRLPEGAEHRDNMVLDIIAELRDGNESAFYALNEDGTMRDEAHWETAVSDIQALSLKHRDVLFTLLDESGEPEDLGYGLIETRVCNGDFDA